MPHPMGDFQAKEACLSYFLSKLCKTTKGYNEEKEKAIRCKVNIFIECE
jgi:hypothetical protein